MPASFVAATPEMIGRGPPASPDIRFEVVRCCFTSPGESAHLLLGAGFPNSPKCVMLDRVHKLRGAFVRTRLLRLLDSGWTTEKGNLFIPALMMDTIFSDRTVWMV